MGDIVIPYGLRARLLIDFDPRTMARRLQPLLNRRGRAAAFELWGDFADRADRVLLRKGVDYAVRLALLNELSAAVRLELYALKSTPAGPVPAPSERVSADVLPFAPRSAGGAA